MAIPKSLVEGFEIPSPAEDLKKARRIEQYRLGEQAIYIPSGLRWGYVPLDAVQTAEQSHRSVTAGKCVAVTEKRPSLLLRTPRGEFLLPLEKTESLQTLLAALGGRGEEIKNNQEE